MNALERRVRGELAEDRSNPDPITWQKSAAGIVVADVSALMRLETSPQSGEDSPRQRPKRYHR